MKRLIGVLTAALLILGAGTALACHLIGHVYCEGTALPLEGVVIQVVSTDAGAPFTGSATTDVNGYYYISLPNAVGSYRASAEVGGSEVVVTPATGFYLFDITAPPQEVVRDWVIASPSCAEEACWLTGGGARFSQITDTYLGQAGKQHNWGGNVNPGCSPTAGQGGQWNDVADALKLHFQGFAMHVVRCGNVDGIPPGSTSPRTPYNFIEFAGTGRLQGIKGNKVDFGTVYFFARCEDRNEPGSNGQRDGAGKDRYFLNVFTNESDPVGSSVVLVDQDGNPATVDPLIITDGNLQIHVSSCDTPAGTQAGGTRPISGASLQAAPSPTISWGKLKIIYK